MKKQAGFGVIEALISVAIGLAVFVLLLAGWREYQRNRQQQQFADVTAREMITVARRSERARETDDETVNLLSSGPNFQAADRTAALMPTVLRNPAGFRPNGYMPSMANIYIIPGRMPSDELRYNAATAWYEAMENRVVGLAVMMLSGPNMDAMAHHAMDTSPKAIEVLAQNVLSRVRSETSMNGGVFDLSTDTLALTGGTGTLTMPRLGGALRAVAGSSSGKALVVMTDLDATSPQITHFQRGKRYTTCQVHPNPANLMVPQCPTGMEGILVFRMCESVGVNGGKVFQTAAGPVTVGIGRYEYNDARRVCGGTCDERKPTGPTSTAVGYGPPPTYCGYDPSLPGKGCGAFDERRVVEVNAPNGVGLAYDPQVAILNRVAKTTVSLKDQIIHEDLTYCDARFTQGTLSTLTRNNSVAMGQASPRTVCCIPEGEREEVK